MFKKNMIALERKANWVRRQVLKMCVCAGAGHIAPAFSCIELLVSLYYGDILHINPRNRFWKDRDRFILSKGHGCAALYAILAKQGFLPVSELDSYCQRGSRLGGHAESNVPGVEAFTGSLGHGLGIGAGMAFAAKMDKQKYLTVVLMGDGECQEGSVWEAAMFAARHSLSNLIAIVDRNRFQALESTEEVVGLEPFVEKWEAFGWEVKVIDGHCLAEILEAFGQVRNRNSAQPLVVIAKTIKGKGVSFMENKPIWHFRIPQGKELKIAHKNLR